MDLYKYQQGLFLKDSQTCTRLSCSLRGRPGRVDRSRPKKCSFGVTFFKRAVGCSMLRQSRIADSRDELYGSAAREVSRSLLLSWLLFEIKHQHRRFGDDRSVKIKSLEAAKIMKINWLVLGCVEADFATKYSLELESS